MTELGRKVRELRKLRGWSTRVLAEKIGIAQSSLSHLEIGKQNWREDQIRKVAAVFGLTPQELFSDIPTEVLHLAGRMDRETGEDPDSLIKLLDFIQANLPPQTIDSLVQKMEQDPHSVRILLRNWIAKNPKYQRAVIDLLNGPAE